MSVVPFSSGLPPDFKFPNVGAKSIDVSVGVLTERLRMVGRWFIRNNRRMQGFIAMEGINSMNPAILRASEIQEGTIFEALWMALMEGEYRLNRTVGAVMDELGLTIPEAVRINTYQVRKRIVYGYNMHIILSSIAVQRNNLAT